MSARLRIALCALLLIGPSVFAGNGRYRVIVAPLPGEDSEVLARQIAAITRGELESGSEGGSTGFVLLASDSAIRTVANHPRVVRIEALSSSQQSPARPGVVRPTSSPSTWTTGTYDYDDSGNIKSITRSDFTEKYVYDEFGRLKSGAVGSGLTEAYTYDQFGNRLTRTTNGGSAFTYGVNSATNRVSEGGANLTATYDTAGRLTGVAALGYSFTYDSFDMVTDSTVEGQRRVHLYTASDERIASATIVGGAATAWTWTIRDPSAKVLRRFTKPPGGSLVWNEDYIYRDSVMLAADVDAPEKRRVFHPDHLGTPRLITGNGGAQIGFHTYYPFGDEITEAQEGDQKKYTGHERDAENLDYMHARFYLPMSGRFLSVDPSRRSARLSTPQTWNRYAYVANNPLKYVDPNGEDMMLVVRDNSGGGITNFGHVALRVFGKGYDFTYDFGRYGRTGGFLNSKGEGVLRVWTNFGAFIAGQKGGGHLRGVHYKTTAAQDQAAMTFFTEQIKAGKQRVENSPVYNEYTLAKQYELQAHNCTTICIDALEETERRTRSHIEGLDEFREENDPRDLYEALGDIYGVGTQSTLIFFDSMSKKKK